MKKIKIYRIVTTAETASFHLKEAMLEFKENYVITVIGDNVTRLSDNFNNVTFIDVPISRKINLISDLKCLFILYFLLRKENPNIVHSIMPKAGLLTALAAFLARVPVRMHTFTGQIWVDYSYLKRLVFILFDKLIVKLNTICYTDSPSQSEFLFSHGIAYASPLPVIGSGSLSGVNLKVFDRNKLSGVRSSLRRKFGINTCDIVFIFLGRKCKDKGVFDLLEAFLSLEIKNISNIKLLLVGPDESDGLLKKRIELSDSTNILQFGQVSNPQDFLCMGDIFCLPSYREGFGSVVIEAAALGLPAIASRIPGLTDAVIHNESGILIEKGNISELQNAMNLLLNDAELRVNMGNLAYDRVKNLFSSEIMLRLQRECYFSNVSIF